MKKFAALLWLVIFSLPGALPFLPLPQPVCLACQVTNHKLCRSEGHDCAHHKKAPSCHSALRNQAQEKSADENQKIGHKCPQSENLVFASEALERLPMSAEFFSYIPLERDFQSSISPILLENVPAAADRPPASSVS